MMAKTRACKLTDCRLTTTYEAETDYINRHRKMTQISNSDVHSRISSISYDVIQEHL